MAESRVIRQRQFAEDEDVGNANELAAVNPWNHSGPGSPKFRAALDSPHGSRRAGDGNEVAEFVRDFRRLVHRGGDFSGDFNHRDETACE